MSAPARMQQVGWRDDPEAVVMSVTHGDTSRPAVPDGLGGAFSAVLDAVLAESPAAALDTALHRLGLAADGLDVRALAVTAHRAAGQAQTRRRRELSLLSLSEAVEPSATRTATGTRPPGAARPAG
jgi:hypothetical protein